MLGKGKEITLGELQIITIIEVGMQNTVWIYLNDRKEELIETDGRFSKANCGFRKNYSTETDMLEKKLIFNSSLLTTKLNTYTLSDLQSCYDCQLVSGGGTIEELIGHNLLAMKLIAKIISR